VRCTLLGILEKKPVDITHTTNHPNNNSEYITDTVTDFLHETTTNDADETNNPSNVSQSASQRPSSTYESRTDTAEEVNSPTNVVVSQSTSQKSSRTYESRTSQRQSSPDESRTGTAGPSQAEAIKSSNTRPTITPARSKRVVGEESQQTPNKKARQEETTDTPFTKSMGILYPRKSTAVLEARSINERVPWHHKKDCFDPNSTKIRDAASRFELELQIMSDSDVLIAGIIVASLLARQTMKGVRCCEQSLTAGMLQSRRTLLITFHLLSAIMT